MSTKLISLFALCVLLCVMLACGGGADNTNTAANANATTNANTKAAATPAAASTPAATTASAGDKIGVAECDDYIAKYEACLNGKVPEAARAAYKTSFETMRTTWKKSAETPQGKAALAQGCKTALEQAKASFGSYGCSW